MNKYKSIIIVKPTIDEKEEKEIEEKYSNLITENGTLTKVENLGKKKLAYQIQKCKDGIYVVFHFESEFEFVAKLEKQYRVDDNVIKFITVRSEEE